MNAASNLSVGARVFHERFGDGIVVSKERKNSVRVDFGKHGQKRIVDTFLETHSAAIIPFPSHRIVRRIEHGRGVVVNR
jgi:hypothetical protein